MTSDDARDERLFSWGIRAVIGDRRGAVIVSSELELDPVLGVIPAPGARVRVVRRRASFTVECLDCGPSEHVAPDDDSTFAVCLRCGRDRWL